ncbi:MAG: sialate O-acetylesterase [Verrucomicrobiae bacterium]|nr:sialate O-acetylesterase [Verrucomicrobiae bacterium]
MKKTLIASLALLAIAPIASAELKLPAIIGDHMVLQQKQANPIWGWDDPGTEITVTFAGQTKTAKAGDDGKWRVTLDPVDANAEPAVLSIAGTSKRDLQDVLVGEVWMCSGQSNMGFTVGGDWNAEVEELAANVPNLRLISVPQVGTQELKDDFNGQWEASTAESCKGFTAVGYFYGKYLQEILGVPVGLIDNAWGGSAAEAWVRRTTIENDPRFKTLVDGWKQRETYLQSDEAKTKHEEAVAKWKEAVAKAKAEGKPAPRAPQAPEQLLNGNARPGNIFGGVVHPTLGYGIKGVIWYQGESNAGRAWEYAQLFPFMIEQWRAEWKQGDFPFYWVQLADFKSEVEQPGESQWAELRESQTKTMSLPNTGQAVIIDLGEGNDIHPKNKHDVAARLVRWPLARDYGYNIEPQSPTYQSMETAGNKIVLTFDHVGGGLRTVDVNDVLGFAICGEDHQWKWAQAKIVGNNKIEVWAEDVAAPVAVRYAWAENPVCNVLSKEGLPVTPFRTDDFPMITKPQDAE